MYHPVRRKSFNLKSALASSEVVVFDLVVFLGILATNSENCLPGILNVLVTRALPHMRKAMETRGELFELYGLIGSKHKPTPIPQDPHAPFPYTQG